MKKLAVLLCALGLGLTASIGGITAVHASAETSNDEMSGLGYSINAATSIYLDAENIKTGSPVFEENWLEGQKSKAHRITVNSTETTAKSASSFLEIKESLAEDIELNAGISLGYEIFTANMEIGFDSSSTIKYEEYASQYYYVLHTESVRYTYSLPDYSSDLSQYRDNLHPNFKSALKNLYSGAISYTDFFDTYGTHVLMNCKYGGDFQLYYSAVSNLVDVGETYSGQITSELQTSVADKLGTNSGISFDLTSVSGIHEGQYMDSFYCKALGGDTFACAGINSNLNSDYRSWANSVNTDPAIIGTTSDGMIPLWNLLPDEYNTPANVSLMQGWFKTYATTHRINVYDYVPVKTLGKPTVTLIRTEEKKITDSGRFNQPCDDVTLSAVSLCSPALMSYYGYDTMNVNITFNARRSPNGTFYIFVYNGTSKTDIKYAEESFTLPDKGSYEKSYNFRFDTADFISDHMVIRYGASGNWSDDWYNSSIRVTVTYSK